MDIARICSEFASFVWSTPTALLLTGAGLLFTVMTVGIQWRALKHGFVVIAGKYDNPEDPGNIPHFQALCAAMSGTIGLGNIAGVAVAIAAGGPGAVFWMWVVGFLGMATKFTECTLACMYRHTDSFGTSRGGPMYSIERGLGRRWKPLAITFALLGTAASLGAGNMFQSHETALIIVNLCKAQAPAGLSTEVQWGIQIAVGVVMSLLAALVLIGGIKRIGHVASLLVPFMCVIYVGAALLVIFAEIDRVPGLLAQILHDAFTGSAAGGAFLGVAARTAMIQGVRRACFSNEAGLGSAPIAHATAQTNEPVREGVVAALEPFIDTIVICTMTALVILITGTLTRPPIGTVAALEEPRVAQTASGPVLEWDLRVDLAEGTELKSGEALFIRSIPGAEQQPVDTVVAVSEVGADHITAVMTFPDTPEGRSQLEETRRLLRAGDEVFLKRDGVNLTALAFDTALGGFGTYFIPFAAFMFAFSTILSWGFYGETCTEYLLGERAVLPFKFLYCAMIIVGASVIELQPVLDFSDGMLGLMLVPNLIGTILLSPKVVRESRSYFARLAAGEFTPVRARGAQPVVPADPDD